MKVITYSHARANLRSVLDEVNETNEHCVITSKTSHVVVLSKKEYDRMMLIITNPMITSKGE